MDSGSPPGMLRSSDVIFEDETHVVGEQTPVALGERLDAAAQRCAHPHDHRRVVGDRSFLHGVIVIRGDT